MKTILAPVDFSVVTARVVDAAAQLAKTSHARVILLHVVPKPTTLRNVLPAVADVKIQTKSEEHIAEKKLLALQRAFRRRLPRMETAHLSGPPAKRIVDEARNRKAAYIVVGSHGRSALRDAVLGSVAGAVVKTAPCPVLVVPPLRAGPPAS